MLSRKHVRDADPEKVILVIIDGIGGCTIPAFGDRSPLEVAHVPTLDAIAGGLKPGAWSPLGLLNTYLREDTGRSARVGACGPPHTHADTHRLAQHLA